ncbi:hypothetical protein D3C73_1390630 [compost metagenome]
MIQRLQAIGSPCPPPQREVVVTTRQVDQILVGPIQHLHAQHIDIETLALFKVGHQQGDMAQAIETTGACR